MRTAYCGHLLAQLGADVTKLVSEDPHASASSDAAAVGDRAIALSLDRAKDVRIHDPGSAAEQLSCASLLADSDVVLLSDLSEARIWFGADVTALKEAHPRLIVGLASAFGSRGEYQSFVGSDPQMLALGGLLSMVGEPDLAPLRLGGCQAEHAAALALFSGVILALFGRARGQRASVETSAVRAVAYVDWKSHIHYVEDGRVLQRGSTTGPLVLPCLDGHMGFYYRVEEWESVKALVGDERLEEERFATQLARDEHRAELFEILAAFTSKLSRDELYHRSQALRIPAGSVLRLDELADDPQLRARSYFRKAVLEDGRTVQLPTVPWTIDGRRELLV